MGTWVHSRRRRQTSTPVPSGRTQVEHDGVGRQQGRGLERRRRRWPRRGDLVAGRREGRAQAPQHLRLVVDHQDPGARAHDSSTRAGTAAGANERTKRAPGRPGVRLEGRPLGLREPAGERQPDAGAA